MYNKVQKIVKKNINLIVAFDSSMTTWIQALKRQKKYQYINTSTFKISERKYNKIKIEKCYIMIMRYDIHYIYFVQLNKSVTSAHVLLTPCNLGKMECLICTVLMLLHLNRI